MTLTDSDLLAIIDEVTIALGEILLSHRQLTEGLLDGKAIATSQGRIEKRRAEIEKEREKIRKARDAIRRRRELEKIRLDHETEVKEGQKHPSRVVPVQNATGKVVGWVQTVGKDRINVLNRRGKVVARQIGNRTLDGMGKLVGFGKQGLRVLGGIEKCKKSGS